MRLAYETWGVLAPDRSNAVLLLHALTGDSHDIGRGRGGTASALARVSAPTLVAAADSDRLYPLSQQQELAALIPGADRPRVVHSACGHDGFLLETAQVAQLVAELLPRAAASGAPGRSPR